MFLLQCLLFGHMVLLLRTLVLLLLVHSSLSFLSARGSYSCFSSNAFSLATWCSFFALSCSFFLSIPRFPSCPRGARTHVSPPMPSLWPHGAPSSHSRAPSSCPFLAFLLVREGLVLMFLLQCLLFGHMVLLLRTL